MNEPIIGEAFSTAGAVHTIAGMAVAASSQIHSLAANEAPEARRYLVVPEGYTAHELDADHHRPFRATGTTSADDVESFKALCERFSDPGSSVIYVRAKIAANEFSLAATAVFNDHEKGEIRPCPGHGDHRAKFVARITPPWQAWMGANGKYMSQEQFAVFLEDNLPDIFTPEGSGAPTGTQILELARDLEINKSSKFRSQIRTTSGATELEMLETESDACKGRIKIFDRFFIAVRPFYGASPWTFEARIRFRTESETKSVKFKVDLVRIDRVLEQAVAEFIEELKLTGLPVICGDKG